MSFDETFVGQDLDLTNVRLRNALVRECSIKSIRGSWLIDCNFAESSLDIDDIRNFLDATVTLNCFTFKDLKMSDLSFEATLYLLSMTKGNDSNRAKLRDMIDPMRLRLFDKVFPLIGMQ